MWLSWFSLFRRVTRIDRQTSPGMIQTAGVQISLFFKFLIYKTGIGGTTFYLKRVPISGELKLPISSVNAYWFYVMPHYLYDITGLMIRNLFSLFCYCSLPVRMIFCMRLMNYRFSFQGSASSDPVKKLSVIESVIKEIHQNRNCRQGKRI